MLLLKCIATLGTGFQRQIAYILTRGTLVSSAEAVVNVRRFFNSTHLAITFH